MELYEEMEALCKNAGAAAAKLALCTTEKKNEALLAMADALRANADGLIEENQKDLDAAEENGLSRAMIDRLSLNHTRIENIARSLCDIAALDDPIGKGEAWDRPSGLHIRRVRVPLGVVAIIYEARPNVTVDSAALCLKTGNAVVLRGGKEAIHTNIAIVKVIKETLDACGLDPHSVELVTSTDRESLSRVMYLVLKTHM